MYHQGIYICHVLFCDRVQDVVRAQSCDATLSTLNSSRVPKPHFEAKDYITCSVLLSQTPGRIFPWIGANNQMWAFPSLT